jgi:serine/threonine protein kinase
MPAALAPPIPIGELVANKYRVEKVLGQGGMGVVVAAMHEQLRQRVAIKMLLPEAKASPNAMARFLREARAAATIRGEHVARVLDVGELEGGAPYIVMEHLEGRDLAAILAESGRLPPDEAVGYLLQACEAIAEAHAAGIVHRDLKPSNVFLTRGPDGTPLVKVLDFGISKALLAAPGEGTLTTTSSFVGSPIYAPPEQLVASHEVDARADIWALGTILFESLAGRTPYVGDSMMHVASRIFHEPPAPLGELRPELDPGLVRAVMRCLEKKPDDRFGDVKALAEALAPFAPAAAISAERVARIVSASSTPRSGPSPLREASGASRDEAHHASHPGAASSVETSMPRASRGRALLVVAGVAATGVVVGFVLFSGRPQPAPVDRPPSGLAPATQTAAPPAPSVVEAPSAQPPQAAQPPSMQQAAPDAVDASANAASSPATTGKGVAGASKKNPLSVAPK